MKQYQYQKTNTPRENQLIDNEHSTKQIASELYVSTRTIDTHRKNIMRKLKIKNVAGMVRVAMDKHSLQLSLTLLFMVFGHLWVTAQQLELTEINYQVKAKETVWARTTSDDGANGLSELVFKVYMKEDSDNQATDIDGSGTESCHDYLADCNQASCNDLWSDQLLANSGPSTTYAYDFHLRSWEDDGSGKCTSTSRSHEAYRFGLRTITDPTDSNASVWTEPNVWHERWASISQPSSNQSRLYWQNAWRYVEGTRGKPIAFRTVEPGDPMQWHVNSTKGKPEGGNNNIGYEDDWSGIISGTSISHRNSSDVTYTFEVVDKMQRITISTDLAASRVSDPHIFLYSGTPQLAYEFLGDNDDVVRGDLNSKLTIDLCPGLYTIVVDALEEGLFKLQLETDDVQQYNGDIDIVTDQSSACESVKIENIIIPAVADYAGGSGEYTWYDITNSVYLSNLDNQKDLINYGNMGTQDIFLARISTICGHEIQLDRIYIRYIPSSLDAGSIGTDDSHIRLGEQIMTGISNTESATGTPAPVSYTWTDQDDETLLDQNGDTIITPSISPAQLGPISESITITRKAKNGCGRSLNTNSIDLMVVGSRAQIKGKVTSPPAGGGTPIAEVEVCAEPDPTVGSTEDRHYATERCAVTDNNGVYTIENLYTGDPAGAGVQYLVSGTFLNHDILADPNSPDIYNDSTFKVLLRNNAIQNSINFEDKTVIPISGNVYHNYTNPSNETLKYAKKGITIKVEQVGNNGIIIPVGSDTTDANGDYSFALPSPGEYRIIPIFDTTLLDQNNQPNTVAHTFFPDTIQEIFIIPADNLDFQDETYKDFHVSFGAACNRDVGAIRVDIKDLDTGDALLSDFLVDNTMKIIRVPAREYTIDVSGVTTDLTNVNNEQKAVIQTQLEAMPNLAMDLLFVADTLAIRVRENPQINIDGIDTYLQEICLGAGETLSDVAVFEQNKNYPDITIFISEGSSNMCPLDTGTLFVNSGQADPTPLEIKDGDAIGFQVTGAFPNFLSPYTTTASIYAEAPGGFFSEQYNQTILTTGSKTNGTDFISLSPEIPSIILHDPPTDGGYAYIDEGVSSITESSTYAEYKTGGGIMGSVKIGADFMMGVSVFGLTFSTKVETSVENINELATYGIRKNSDSFSTTTTFNRAIKTSAEPRFIGTDADVVVTEVYNKTFSEALFLDLDGCTPMVIDTIMLKSDSVASTAVRTIWDIKNIIIPDLQQLLEQETDDKKYFDFEAQISNWRQIVNGNQDNINHHIKRMQEDSLSRISIGAGVHYDYDFTEASSHSYTHEYLMEIDEELAVKGNFEVAGSGIGGKVYIKAQQRFTRKPTEEVQNDTSTNIGYHLYDDDIGDQFLIAIYDDATPIFNLEAGRTSCPYTVWNEELPIATAKTFDIGLNMQTTAINVDPIQGHTFEFDLRNSSAQNVNFEVGKNFSEGQFSTVSLSGSQQDAFQSLLVPNQTDRVTVNVKKLGGSDSQTISIYVRPACDDRFLNNVFIPFHVKYLSEISPITIANIADGQVINANSNKSLDIKMIDYDKSKMDRVVLEYKNILDSSPTYNTSSSFDLTDVGSVFNDNPTVGTIVPWDLSEIPSDGDYYIRLTTLRNGVQGSNGSQSIPITVDRSKPYVFGLPQPIDDNYDINANDVISVNYNENVCPNGVTNAVATISDLANPTSPLINTVVTCSDNQIVIVEEGTSLNNREPSIYRVKLSDVMDIYGNQAEDYYWTFLVGAYDPSDLACLPDINITNNNLNQDAINATAYRALVINSNGQTPNFGTTSYVAEEAVNLEPGFEVKAGGVFLVDIKVCDNDE